MLQRHFLKEQAGCFITQYCIFKKRAKNADIFKKKSHFLEISDK
jgi:hypothetical protein